MSISIIHSSLCDIQFIYSTDLLPLMSEIRKSTINTKNKIFAIPAAPEAIPPNPNMAAIIATIKKITVQRSIYRKFLVKQSVNEE